MVVASELCSRALMWRTGSLQSRREKNVKVAWQLVHSSQLLIFFFFDCWAIWATANSQQEKGVLAVMEGMKKRLYCALRNLTVFHSSHQLDFCCLMPKTTNEQLKIANGWDGNTPTVKPPSVHPKTIPMFMPTATPIAAIASISYVASLSGRKTGRNDCECFIRSNTSL